MKVTQSLTAAITAAALVAGAGFAYAQSGTTPGAPGDLNNQNTAAQKIPSTPDASTNANTTLQAQPSTNTTDTGAMNNTAPSTMDTTLQPRADRN